MGRVSSRERQGKVAGTYVCGNRHSDTFVGSVGHTQRARVRRTLSLVQCRGRLVAKQRVRNPVTQISSGNLNKQQANPYHLVELE